MMKYFSMTALLTLHRVFSVIFNYIIVRLTTVPEYAAVSNFTFVCNFAYQACRFGHEFEFQRLIHQSDVSTRVSHLNAVFFTTSIFFAFSSTIVAFLTLRFGFSEASQLFGVPYFAVMFFVSSLFMTGFFITNMYAAFNFKAMSFFVGLSAD